MVVWVCLLWDGNSTFAVECWYLWNALDAIKVLSFLLQEQHVISMFLYLRWDSPIDVHFNL